MPNNADSDTELRAFAARDPEAFWAAQAARLEWIAPWHTVKNTSFTGDVSIRWFEGGKLNVAANCLDRHLAARADKTAILWEGDEPGESRALTYRALHAEVCRLANVLKKHGVRKGDCVTIYMPMVPEAAVAMLACARIGAMHSVIFAGFSAESIRSRMEDGGSRFVITADEGRRGGETVPLKVTLDAALKASPLEGGRLEGGGAAITDPRGPTPTLTLPPQGEGNTPVASVLVYSHTNAPIPMQPGRDFWWHEEMAQVSADCPPEPMEAEDPFFILYTSGSTGKPKGILHSTAGYLLYAATTHATVFDLREEDIYWSTADIGWVTGHSYLVYGPLANGATTLMFEGVPSYPTPARFWEVIDKHRVSIFYTAPTAIRALMREGDAYLNSTHRRSLRILGSVGEPINPEAWRWFHEQVGQSRCPIMDTWWQTETGGHMITPLPSMPHLKPGSAMQPFYGITPVLLSAEGAVIEGEGEGMLCIADAWPGQARTIFGDHARFIETYFRPFPGYYFSGDGARRDADGDWWITGRVDDVLNISGHRLGTAEVESALVGHPAVAEAAVVGFPHEIKGQGIYCFVLLNADTPGHPALEQALKQEVRRVIGPIATPDRILFAPGLPKTRSGKIMRRILRKIASGEAEGLGDVSTLQNPEVVEQLIVLNGGEIYDA